MRTLCTVLLIALGACSGEHAAHWSYEGDTGPEHWADLDPAYALARTGQQQSPIDIETATATAQEGAALKLHYQPTELNVVNNGHTIEVRFTDGSYIELDGERFNLAQFHFHSPSEHTIDGKFAAMEMHLVHSNSEGELAVVGAMIHEGAEHAAFGSIFPHFPTQAGQANQVSEVQVDPTELLPGDLASYRYSGSLTTPPCTEGVAWVVLKTPVEVSAAQIEHFHSLYKGNNRLIQPLNGRDVKLFH